MGEPAEEPEELIELVLRGLEASGRESGVPSLGLVPIRRDDPGAVARYMLERTQPIYRRSP